MDKTGRQRLEQLVIMILSRCGKGRDRSAMEAVFKRNDRGIVSALLFSRVLSRRLDRALVCFRAGVAKEHLLHAGELAQHLCQMCAWLGIIEVGHMLYFGKLFRDSGDPCVIGNTEAGNGNTRTHVDIALARLVVELSALAADDLLREAGVGGHDVFCIQFLGGHEDTFFF